MKNKVKVYLLELLLIIIIFFALFASNILKRSVLSIIMLIYMFVVYYSLKKRKTNSIYKNQVTIFMIIFALIYVGGFYLLGLYFGFVKSKILLSFWSVYTFVIPLTIIIIASEIMRKVF